MIQCNRCFATFLILVLWGTGGSPSLGFSTMNHSLLARTSVRRSTFGLSTTNLVRGMSSTKSDEEQQRVAIVGGGLAGLSAAFHLLNKTVTSIGSSPLHITIIDTAPVGTGGASSVAGGLLHPFSPRMKVIHLGMEGLESTNRLISAAAKYKPECVLRNELFRVALAEQHAEQLQEASSKFPQHCTWLDSDAMNRRCNTESSMGGVRVSSGKVIHVPTYLEGLWLACRDLSGGTAEWLLIEDEESEEQQQERLQDFDTVILSAGAGLFQSKMLVNCTKWPVQSVLGQSVEISIPPTAKSAPSEQQLQYDAVLCGKYVTPLLDKKRMLIGATREFNSDKLSKEGVVDELRSRSYDLAPWLWDNGKVEKVTTGWRVQSNRSSEGRTPILGKVPPNESELHRNTWIFTGLSSRGLIHHALYGDVLTDSILGGDEEYIFSTYSHLGWWRKPFKQP